MRSSSLRQQEVGVRAVVIDALEAAVGDLASVGHQPLTLPPFVVPSTSTSARWAPRAKSSNVIGALALRLHHDRSRSPPTRSPFSSLPGSRSGSTRSAPTILQTLAVEGRPCPTEANQPIDLDAEVSPSRCAAPPDASSLRTSARRPAAPAAPRPSRNSLNQQLRADLDEVSARGRRQSWTARSAPSCPLVDADRCRGPPRAASGTRRSRASPASRARSTGAAPRHAAAARSAG